MNIEKERNKFRQTFATDKEIEKLKEVTKEKDICYAIRQAILNTIGGA